MKNKQSLRTVHAALASVVMYYVLELSRSGRTWIDWIVIGLVTGAILWNLIQLGRRLHRCQGSRAPWRVLRTALFWIVGLFNTALIRAEDVGTWKHWLGWALLLVALLDSIALFRQERRCLAEDALRASSSQA